MNVSDIAREVGIAPSAVRFYERREPSRPPTARATAIASTRLTICAGFGLSSACGASGSTSTPPAGWPSCARRGNAT